ncbi:hypothetical protein ES705_27850 [subsurface metagenome]
MTDVPRYRTLLIDSDLRFPTVHDRLGLMQSPGLTEILEGNIGLNSEMLDTEKENLKVITSGNLPSYPVELLESEKLKDLIKKLKSEFDLILVDAPPLIPYSDASVLSSQVDGVLLIVASGRTRREDIQQVQSTLQDNQAKVLNADFENSAGNITMRSLKKFRFSSVIEAVSQPPKPVLGVVSDPE